MNPDDFKAALAQFASGVTVVTAPAVGSQPPAGFTASAFTSVSLDPPLVLICLARSAQSHAAFMNAQHIGISILGDGQSEIALRFADSKADKFASDMSMSDYHDVPVVDSAPGHLYCRIDQCIAKGDHTILIAEVEQAETRDGQPLLYWKRNFRTVSGVGS